MKVKIRKGDTVEIMSGKADDKGKRGPVIRVLPDEGRLVVQGINIHTKHQRQVQTQGRTINPGRIQFEAPLAIANVMLVCPKCNEPTRVGVQLDDSGSHRVCKNCQALID
ncbi:MAG: large subunit ribosomal protein L24 [Anaerolineaceae bacterium]|nr:MAG: large subunit ribosomal protein L24 [Anaerolineaceae bacterium]